MMSLKRFRRRGDQEDVEALIPQYEDETSLQRQLHPKMRTLQMLRGLSMGYMPSTEQLIIILRTLLASDVLSLEETPASDTGILLIKYCRKWLKDFIDFLHVKNGDDQMQEFLWSAKRARMDVDTKKLAQSASRAKQKADVNAAYQSAYAIGDLLLTNADFRRFLGDLGNISQHVLSDTAFSLSSAAEKAGEDLIQTEQGAKDLTTTDEAEAPPSQADLEDGTKQVIGTLTDGIAQTGHDAVQSVEKNVSEDEKNVLTNRLKTAVINLRKKDKYTDSVSTLGLLIQRYALFYSRGVEETVQASEDSIHVNSDLDNAARSLWSLVKTFGDQGAWNKAEEYYIKVVQHSKRDPTFEKVVGEISNFIQGLLSDPSFYESPKQKVQELRDKVQHLGASTGLRDDVEALIEQLRIVYHSVLTDENVVTMVETTTKIFQICSPPDEILSRDLQQDFSQTFLPILIRGIQYIPIPRLEISVPAIDLLLENLIIEPGKTVNQSSFLPYRFLIRGQKDLEIRKTHTMQTTTSSTNIITISLNGLSVRAEEVGFWLETHMKFLHLHDAGIASFELDEKGLDVTLDIEIGRERLEEIISLRRVRVRVHKLNYKLRTSKLSWLAWLVKPIMRSILRKVMEKQIAAAIADALHAANRELVFARERLRATRISDPQDIRTFIKAVATRLTPEDNPDLYAFVGLKPSKGKFENVYAPGSVVKLWDEEARVAKDQMEDADMNKGRWRSEVFDVPVVAP